MTLENKMEFDLSQWQNVSDTCKDFITHLLEKDSSKRISLNEALEHEWFKGIDMNTKTGHMQNKGNSAFKSKKLHLSE